MAVPFSRPHPVDADVVGVAEAIESVLLNFRKISISLRLEPCKSNARSYTGDGELLGRSFIGDGPLSELNVIPVADRMFLSSFLSCSSSRLHAKPAASCARRQVNESDSPKHTKNTTLQVKNYR